MQNYQMIRTDIISAIPISRYIHSVSVEEYALLLGERYNFTYEELNKLSIAALAHDMDKPKSRSIQMAYIIENMKPTPLKGELKNESLHAIMAMLRLSIDFKITDKEILNAVRYHSIPRPKMSIYEKIIYVSDWVVHEKNDENARRIKIMLDKDLDEAVLMGIQYTIIDRIAKGKPIHQRYVETMNKLLKRKGRH